MSALVWKKVPRAATCPLACHSLLLANIGDVLEVGGDPGAQVLELVSEGDIILILITKDDISGGGSACSSGEGSSREEHCFSF